MNLVQMSLAGAVMILVIAGLRILFLNKLPKKMFLVLWWVVLFRLLVPVSLPSQFSIYNWKQADQMYSGQTYSAQIQSNQVQPGQKRTNQGDSDKVVFELAEDLSQGTILQTANRENAGNGEVTEEKGRGEYVGSNREKLIGTATGSFKWSWLWVAGMFLSALFFISAYVRGIREFRSSFPVEKEKVRDWQANHPSKRRIQIRWSERIQAPLSYGIIRPVILMPKNTDWEAGQQLAYVLEHEYVHIKRLDAATKLILTAVLCIHWFNPLVWVMYLLFNRDLEISCDEEVVRHFGEEGRAGYARALIGMEEKKAGFLSLCNGFGKIAIEERIKAIMKIKKTSVMALAVAVILVVAVALGFGTTAKAGMKEQREYLKSALSISYTEKEREMLADLWLDDYESMTIPEYQDKIWSMTDSKEYTDLIDSFSGTEWAFETDNKEGEALDQYFQYYDKIFSPLCGDHWRQREFDGAMFLQGSQVYHMAMPDQGNKLVDIAVFEYEIGLQIENPEKLLVGQYQNARLQTEQDMEDMLKRMVEGKSEAELKDSQFMDVYLEKETGRIASERSDENLTVSINYSFLPADISAKDLDFTEGKALNQGNEESQEMDWGIQEDIEQQMDFYHRMIDQINHIIEKYNQEIQKIAAQEGENQEEWRYPPASQEDFDSLLELMKPDYKNRTVADFDAALLDWCNADYDRMERVSESVSREKYGITLTEEEESFVELTFGLSGEENYRLINNMKAGEPEKEEDLRYGWINQIFYSASDDELAWASFWYTFYWYIADRDQLTVGDRDARVKGFMKEVETNFYSTDLEELLTRGEEEWISLLKETAEKYSNELFRIEIAEDHVSCERMDERDLATERDW